MHGLLVVDVQPAYNRWCDTVVRDVVKRINNTVKPTFIMWVGEGLTVDDECSVYHYLMDNGARSSKLDACQFIEKDYGFFRGWMDTGVPNDTIVHVGRHLYQTDIASTDDVDLEEVLEDQLHQVLGKDALRLPYFNESRLRNFDKFDTCGGGRDECLAEIELYLAMKDMTFTRLNNLVY